MDDLDTPALWVDLDQLERNITLLSNFFQKADVNWRPHIKGIKIPAIAHKAAHAGAIGVTCAKVSEAEVMAWAGITDILIANQVVARHKIRRLANLCRQAEVKVAVDHATNVAQLGQIASEYGTEIGILVEINTGMNRAGTLPGQPTVELSKLVNQTKGLRYRGLMAWEGHAVSIEDPQEKHDTIASSIEALHRTVEMCRTVDLPIEIISGGGSGTYKITTPLADITEVQAGGAIFCDASYQKWGVDTQPSLFIRSLVTSRPDPQRVIIDAGFKALPAWAGRTPEAVNMPDFASFRPSAEHGTVTLSRPNTEIQIGQVFDFMVGYGDSTVFLHDTLYGVRNQRIETVWPIHGRGKIH